MQEVSSKAEAVAVLRRDEERLDHLGGLEVAAELVKLREPELPAGEIRVGRVVGVAPEVSEVLHEDEGAVLLVAREGRVLGDLPEYERAPGIRVVRGELADERVALGRGQNAARVCVERDRARRARR